MNPHLGWMGFIELRGRHGPGFFRVIRVTFVRGDTAFDSGFRQSLRLNSELLIRQAAVFADNGSRPQSEKQQAH